MAAAVGALGYAWFAAGTTPFTTAADVVTAIPLAAVLAVVVLQWWAGRAAPIMEGAIGRRRPWSRMVAADPPRTGSSLPWLLVVLGLIAWELVTYFSGPRSAHPTFSSIEDAVARWHVAKAAVLLCWLALGWYLVRR